MNQLKMYRLKDIPIRELALPEGYSISNYKDESDKLPWLECCKNGDLVGDENNPNSFDISITGHEFVKNPQEDVFFLDYKDEHIGTVTAIHNTKENIGIVHMVSIRTDFRGKGLGKYLCNVAVRKLTAQDVDYIYLTTDEFRTGAIKSYISAGFLPVNYDTDMKGRWESVIQGYDIDKIDMLNEDASFSCTIYNTQQK